jgi:hypothetical protein
MPLNLGGGGGEIRPFIRFKPSINAWEMSAEDGVVEFEWSSPAVFDVENIKLGWLLLAEGVREWQPWPGNKQTPRPEGDWKQGFICSVFSKSIFKDEPVREYSSSSTGNVEFIKKLYNEAESKFGDGQVPVVKITGNRAERIGKGNTRIPTFEIVKFVARPAELQSSAIEEEPLTLNTPPKAAPKKVEVEEF